MVIDTSAIVAVLFDEPERHLFNRLIVEDPKRVLSSGTYLEAGIVVEARAGESGGRELDLYLQKAGVDVVPFDADQADIARRAFRRFGKGNNPAALNYGDCFAYALSILSGEPLLFKGEDFSKTDVTAVEWHM